jgi:hypothetical protein
MRLSEIESLIDLDGREILCSLLQANVDERGDGNVGESIIGSDGYFRNHKRLSERKLKTLFGTIKIERVGYSSRNVGSLFPKDGQLNLPNESYSFSLQKLLVYEVIKGSFGEAVETIKRLIGIIIPLKQAEKIVLEAAKDFYNFYDRSVSTAHFQDNLLIITLDGKGVVIRSEDLRLATRKKADNNTHKMQQRLSPGEKRNSKRMAAVASVYLVKPFVRTPFEVANELFDERNEKKRKRPKPSFKRVWASLELSFETIVCNMFAEAINRDPKKDKEWIALVDGDPKQIQYLEKHAKKHAINLTIICDFIHVLEYIWKASNVFFTEPENRESWVKERLLRVLQGKSSLVAAGIKRSATRKKLTLSKREPVDKCANYLLNLAPYIKYHEYLNKGYPIATGVIEGACRYLVQDRMGITGARWGLCGAEAVLKLRSLKVSGEFDEYWKFYEKQEFIRNHESKYANPIILTS